MRKQKKTTTSHGAEEARTERLESRLTTEEKKLLQTAANLEGRSLTDFVLASARAAAVLTVQQHLIIRLATLDSEAFAAAILKPPEANAKLRQAAARYKRLARV